MRKKILVIDDESEGMDFVQGLLQEEGHEVISCPGGDLAVALAMQERPDLILMDILMPKRGGVDVLREMFLNSGLGRIPVIMISGIFPFLGTDGAEVLCSAHGEGNPQESHPLGVRVLGHLEKPIQPQKLLEKVRGIFAGMRLG